jgi:hypothetical protein
MIQAGPIRPGGYNRENSAGRCLLARLKSYITVDQVITLQNAKGAFSNSNTFAVLLCHNHGFKALQIKASFGGHWHRKRNKRAGLFLYCRTRRAPPTINSRFKQSIE